MNPKLKSILAAMAMILSGILCVAFIYAAFAASGYNLADALMAAYFGLMTYLHADHRKMIRDSIKAHDELEKANDQMRENRFRWDDLTARAAARSQRRARREEARRQNEQARQAREETTADVPQADTAPHPDTPPAESDIDRQKEQLDMDVDELQKMLQNDKAAEDQPAEGEKK